MANYNYNSNNNVHHAVPTGSHSVFRSRCEYSSADGSFVVQRQRSIVSVCTQNTLFLPPKTTTHPHPHFTLQHTSRLNVMHYNDHLFQRYVARQIHYLFEVTSNFRIGLSSSHLPLDSIARYTLDQFHRTLSSHPKRHES